MPKSRKLRRKARPPRGDAAPAFATGESRGAEFMTVGWLMTALTTLTCELGGAAASWFAKRNPDVLSITALANVLLFAAVVTGLFSLALLAAAWKLRTVKPPHGLTVLAIVICLTPLATVALRQWLH